MQVALIVEPQRLQTGDVSSRFDGKWILVKVVTPLQAITAIQAVMFDAIVMPLGRAEDDEYASLHATIRLVAAHSAVVFAPSVEVG